MIFILVFSFLIAVFFVVGVMGWFPGLSTRITEDQSRAYWANTVLFSVNDYKVTSDGRVDFSVENQATDNLFLNEIYLDGRPIGLSEKVFTAGQLKTVSGNARVCGFPGDRFEVELRINYDNQDVGVMNKNQYGVKPFVGFCS